MADGGEKRGTEKHRSLVISRLKRASFGKIKSVSFNLLSALFWYNIEEKRTQALTMLL